MGKIRSTARGSGTSILSLTSEPDQSRTTKGPKPEEARHSIFEKGKRANPGDFPLTRRTTKRKIDKSFGRGKNKLDRCCPSTPNYELAIDLFSNVKIASCNGVFIECKPKKI